MSSWRSSDIDHDDEVLFIKAYSLKRTTIQGAAHPKPDAEATVGDVTGSGEAGAEADTSDEKSEGHEESLQGGSGQEHVTIHAIDEKKRNDESENV